MGEFEDRGSKNKYLQLLCGIPKENWTAPNILKDDGQIKYLLEGGRFLRRTVFLLGAMGDQEGTYLVGKYGREK